MSTFDQLLNEFRYNLEDFYVNEEEAPINNSDITNQLASVRNNISLSNETSSKRLEELHRALNHAELYLQEDSTVFDPERLTYMFKAIHGRLYNQCVSEETKSHLIRNGLCSNDFNNHVASIKHLIRYLELHQHKVDFLAPLILDDFRFIVKQLKDITNVTYTNNTFNELASILDDYKQHVPSNK